MNEIFTATPTSGSNYILIILDLFYPFLLQYKQQQQQQQQMVEWVSYNVYSHEKSWVKESYHERERNLIFSSTN